MAGAELSRVRLLREITSKIDKALPACELTPDAEQLHAARSDLNLPREEATSKVIRCWGSPQPTAEAAKEDAARVALHRLRDELKLQIKEADYKTLYAGLTVEFAALNEKYNKLKWEYRLLKDAYDSVVAERDRYAAERVILREAIGRCHALLNRVPAAAAAAATDLAAAVVPPPA